MDIVIGNGWEVVNKTHLNTQNPSNKISNTDFGLQKKHLRRKFHHYVNKTFNTHSIYA